MTAPRSVRGPVAGGLAALALLLAGCGSGLSSGGSAAGAGPQAGTGQEAAAGTTVAQPQAAGGPPETATMICGGDVKSKVTQALKLASPPQTTGHWAAPVYTCTYALPMGPMVLTVTVAPDKASAGRRFDALPHSTTLAGLGERSQSTSDGTVEVLKDNQILSVDTTHLPDVFGADGQKRTDFAYEVASDVLGCWTGDGDE